MDKRRIDISPKKIHKWPIGTWKSVQHHESLAKCKSELQLDSLGRLLWKRIEKTSAGEDVEKSEPLCTADRNGQQGSNCANSITIKKMFKLKLVKI